MKRCPYISDNEGDEMKISSSSSPAGYYMALTLLTFVILAVVVIAST